MRASGELRSRPVCFRLLAAIHPAPREGLGALAVGAGLDVREGARGAGRFVEIAWGDCACSLYTRKQGRDRVVALAEALLTQSCEVQLLLARDEEPLNFDGAPVRVSLDQLRTEGLGSLPQGRVARLVLA